MSPHRMIARLCDRKKLAEAHYLITLSFDGPRQFAPGQFAMVRGPWDKDPLLGRPLAILREVPEGWEFYFRVTGRGTDRLAKDPLGSLCELTGPLGTPFDLPSHEQEAWLCAGGIGIASVLPVAWEVLRQGGAARLFFGARDADGLCLASRLEGIPFDLASDDGARGYKGLVTDLLARALSERRKDPVIFACGPELMMKAAARLCLEADVACQVSLEAPMACGFGVCLGCSRDLAQRRVLICQAGPCLDAKEVYP